MKDCHCKGWKSATQRAILIKSQLTFKSGKQMLPYDAELNLKAKPIVNKNDSTDTNQYYKEE